MKKLIAKYWPLLLVVILSYWAIKPLFHAGFFPMHDDEQIARLYELDQALLGKQFPPRWVSNLGFGYGYPFYNFYPPLVYYLGEIFHILGFSLIVSTKMVMGLGFILSGIFMYLLAKELFNRFGAIICAIFYIYAPYHSVDLYVRGALAEFYAFVFIPAVFWATIKLIKNKNYKWLIINSLFLSCLLLSHNLIFLIFAPIYLTFGLFFNYYLKGKTKTLILLTISGLLFLGVTTYFWLPALTERKYTLVNEILTRELASYQLHFVYLRQLWNSPWGYGGSLYGLEDGLSFEVGKLHLILSLLAGIFGLLFWFKKKRNALIILFLFIEFVGCLFMTSFHSQFIWDKLKFLWYLQFSWRYLSLVVVFSSLLSGAIISDLINFLGKRKLFQWLIFIISIFLVILTNQDYFKPAGYLEVDDGKYISETDIKWRVSGMSFEFVSKTVATRLSDIGTTQLDIKEDEIAKSLYEVISGKVEVIRIGKNIPHKKILITKGGGILRINSYNFPGWRAFIDNNEVNIKETGKLRLITLDIPEGEHQIEVVFTNTPIRTIANVTSLVCLVVLVMLMLK